MGAINVGQLPRAAGVSLGESFAGVRLFFDSTE